MKFHENQFIGSRVVTDGQTTKLTNTFLQLVRTSEKLNTTVEVAGNKGSDKQATRPTGVCVQYVWFRYYPRWPVI